MGTGPPSDVIKYIYMSCRPITVEAFGTEQGMVLVIEDDVDKEYYSFKERKTLSKIEDDVDEEYC